MQLPLNFLCVLCAFAREKPLTSSPDDSAYEDVVFVSRQGAKLAKESQKRETSDPAALGASPMTPSFWSRLAKRC
jgi:hypothetical protein